MTFWEFMQQPKPLAVLAGVAGAAAMAVTDWRSPWRLAQHLFVGSLSAAFATPWFYPVFNWAFDIAQVPPEFHANSAAFITGAGAIYILEFGLAFWRRKASGSE